MFIVKYLDLPRSSLAGTWLLPSPALLEQGSDAKASCWEPLLLSQCLEQQREQPLTPAAGCGVFVCFLITQVGDHPSSYLICLFL